MKTDRRKLAEQAASKTSPLDLAIANRNRDTKSMVIEALKHQQTLRLLSADHISGRA